eukprot:9408217-Pyramimonas_sp.AAC.1
MIKDAPRWSSPEKKGTRPSDAKSNRPGLALEDRVRPVLHLPQVAEQGQRPVALPPPLARADARAVADAGRAQPGGPQLPEQPQRVLPLPALLARADARVVCDV